MDISEAVLREKNENRSMNEQLLELKEQVQELSLKVAQMDMLDRSSGEDTYTIPDNHPVVDEIRRCHEQINAVIATTLSKPESVNQEKLQVCMAALELFERYKIAMVNMCSVTKFKYPTVPQSCLKRPS